MARSESVLGYQLNKVVIMVADDQAKKDREHGEHLVYAEQQKALETMAEALLKAFGHPPKTGETPEGLVPPSLQTDWVDVEWGEKGFKLRLVGHSTVDRLGKTDGITSMNCELWQPDGSVVPFFRLGHGAEVKNALDRKATGPELDLFQNAVQHIGVSLAEKPAPQPQA